MWMNSKFAGRCKECNELIEADDRVFYDQQEHKVYCQDCGSSLDEDPLDIKAIDTAFQRRARQAQARK